MLPLHHRTQEHTDAIGMSCTSRFRVPVIPSVLPPMLPPSAAQGRGPGDVGTFPKTHKLSVAKTCTYISESAPQAVNHSVRPELRREIIPLRVGTKGYVRVVAEDCTSRNLCPTAHVTAQTPPQAFSAVLRLSSKLPCRG